MGHALIGKTLYVVSHLVKDINELVGPRGHGEMVALPALNGLHGEDLENTFCGRDERPSNLEKELLTWGKGDSLLLRVTGGEREEEDEESDEKNQKRFHRTGNHYHENTKVRKHKIEKEYRSQ